MKVFDDGLVNDDEKVAQFLLQNIPNSRLELKILTLLETKLITIDTLFLTKTAENPGPFGRTSLYGP